MKRLTVAALAVAVAVPGFANEFAPAMEEYLHANIEGWVTNPVILDAVKRQNDLNANLNQADIDALDQAWRAEVGSSDTPTITPVLSNAAADYLREHVDNSAGAITEIFIMDSHGLNVAASDVTSDMWQGDEAKFSETYPNGAGAFHISEVDFDESTQNFQGQISMSLVDPESGAVIGAITVGVNADALM